MLETMMTAELEWPLGYFGPLQRMWVARNPPSFAFVELEDPWDAGLDGRTVCGHLDQRFESSAVGVRTGQEVFQLVWNPRNFKKVSLPLLWVRRSVCDSLVAHRVKAFACNAGDLGLILESGRFPGKGNGNPLQYSCLENAMDGRAW